MSFCENDVFGSDPVNIRWNIVRGDTSTLRIDFLNNDETTFIDTEGWTYSASAYDKKTDIIDELEIEQGDGYVIVIAPSDITSLWGKTYGGVVAELTFDLEVTLDDEYNSVWTPVIGTISVIGDVTGGL